MRFARLVLAGCLAAAVPVAAASAATSPQATPCPTASLVDAALGQKALEVPVATVFPFAKTCTYRHYSEGGPANGKMTITFEMDTKQTFAAGESAAARALPGSVIKVSGLGEEAWRTDGGSLYVFTGTVQVKILALLSETFQLGGTRSASSSSEPRSRRRSARAAAGGEERAARTLGRQRPNAACRARDG